MSAERLYADLLAEYEERGFGRSWDRLPFVPQRCSECGWPHVDVSTVTACSSCRRKAEAKEGG